VDRAVAAQGAAAGEGAGEPSAVAGSLGLVGVALSVFVSRLGRVEGDAAWPAAVGFDVEIAGLFLRGIAAPWCSGAAHDLGWKGSWS